MGLGQCCACRAPVPVRPQRGDGTLPSRRRPVLQPAARATHSAHRGPACDRRTALSGQWATSDGPGGAPIRLLCNANEHDRRYRRNHAAAPRARTRNEAAYMVCILRGKQRLQGVRVRNFRSGVNISHSETELRKPLALAQGVPRDPRAPPPLLAVRAEKRGTPRAPAARLRASGDAHIDTLDGRRDGGLRTTFDASVFTSVAISSRGCNAHRTARVKRFDQGCLMCGGMRAA